jgi:hypothetical protein
LAIYYTSSKYDTIQSAAFAALAATVIVSSPVADPSITIFCPLTAFNAPPEGTGAALTKNTSSTPVVALQFLLILTDTVISLADVFAISMPVALG